jgi:cysteinyl-tRNA synthetase
LKRIRISSDGSSDISEYLQKTEYTFSETIADNLNTPDALAVIFEIISFINKTIDSTGLSPTDHQAVIDLFGRLEAVTGIFDLSLLQSAEIPDHIHALLRAREEAKEKRDFVLADSIRDQITHEGYKIIDTKKGSIAEYVQS